VLRDAAGATFVDVRRLYPDTGICTFDPGFNSTVGATRNPACPCSPQRHVSPCSAQMATLFCSTQSSFQIN